MIYFACPKCGTRLSADPGSTGQLALCSKCNQQVTVPNPPMAVRIDTASEKGRQLAMWSKIRHHPLALLGIAAALLLICATVGIMRWRLATPQARIIHTAQELKEQLTGFTEGEVRRALGDPVEIIEIPPHVEVGYTTPMRFQEEMQRAVLERHSEPEERRWVYHKQTRDSGTGELRSTLHVWFRSGRVVYVSVR